MDTIILETLKTLNERLQKIDVFQDVPGFVCANLAAELSASLSVIAADGMIAASERTLMMDEPLTGANHIRKYQKNVYDMEHGLFVTVYPLVCASRCFGFLRVFRKNEPLREDEELLLEWAVSILSLSFLARKEENDEDTRKSISAVRSALANMTYSEREVIYRILDKLGGHDGVVVAWRIAKEYGVSGSVTNNALSKLQSAQLIETRSMGAKGTNIRVINPFLLTEIHKYF